LSVPQKICGLTNQGCEAAIESHGQLQRWRLLGCLLDEAQPCEIDG
jgi:hypothetical protein